MSEARTLKLGHEQAFLFLGDEYDGAPTRDRDGALWAVRARLRVPGLDASALVHLSESPPQDLLLPAFFADLVGGWHGLREWRAYDGGLTVACTHDDRGTVSMGTELRDLNLGWVVRAVVPLDAGRLEQLAADVAAFFAP
jgi:hypothetical protein